ncbi:hypothetical protein J1605_010347 [Eschrichtius robustus]|uniref:Mitochondrial import inner membrane translocase subunit Tim21 n=1 Tax=Eschrichtius robustus TaxID=9764 RepID=A0AB34GU61_ESCRO|nr:hypothetical protein J1605_010347 [Eschrichtius robustus]
MICTFLRAVRCTEKLHRSSGKRLFLAHFVLNKACLKTEPNWRWGPQEQKRTVRPRCILGVTQKTVWTQGQSLQRAKEDGSKQVSAHRSQSGETAISTSQKVHSVPPVLQATIGESRDSRATTPCRASQLLLPPGTSARGQPVASDPAPKSQFGAASWDHSVKEAGRDFTYLIVVLIGITITGGLFYTIFRELFSSSSPNKIYGKALEKCRLHPEVLSVFGEPVKGYGEMTRRGRRQHVSFIEYVKDGLKHMRVKFYIQGSEPGKQGTVHLEVKENPESGEYEFQYIFVELEPYSRRTIVIEDNRS